MCRAYMLDGRLSTPLLQVKVFRHRGQVIITVDEDNDYIDGIIKIVRIYNI
jgi:hypothetical protein